MASRGGPCYRIGGLARASGFSAKAIRFYEDIGLLPPARRTTAGYRTYGVQDLDRLAFIRRAKALDLTLDEIREIMAVREEGRPPCDYVRSVLDEKIARIQEQIRALGSLERELVALREQADGRTRADTGRYCAIIESAHAR